MQDYQDDLAGREFAQWLIENPNLAAALDQSVEFDSFYDPEFVQNLEIGLAAEVFLDGVFGETYEIRRVDAGLEKIGVDRIYVHRKSGENHTVQIKTDLRAHQTGHAFIQTVARDIPWKDGWGYTCRAEYLLLFIPIRGEVHVFEPKYLKEYLKSWEKQHKHIWVKKGTHQSRGVLVPLEHIEDKAMMTIRSLKLKVSVATLLNRPATNQP